MKYFRAALILADALELGDPDECGIGLSAYPENKALASMREDFCSDVLSQLCEASSQGEPKSRHGMILVGLM
ncbi:hypothetical protein [Streptomyces virginiae]|uniref:hypothetical protein n=1 Tax=Streptomyces virginiae TaxID=1961 RepID=UPI0036AC69F3